MEQKLVTFLYTKVTKKELKNLKKYEALSSSWATGKFDVQKLVNSPTQKTSQYKNLG